MKPVLFRILKAILYPFVSCYRVIQEAPIICCDDELVGFGDCARYPDPEPAEASLYKLKHSA